MKKTLLLALALFGMFSLAKAADSYLSITRSYTGDDHIKIALKADAANTIVQIDYGDEILVEKTIGTSGTDVSGRLEGPTVKIYGEGIIWFYCDSNELTEVDISNYPTLLGLNCNNNNLTTLDVSKNTLLHLLYCADNELTSLDLSNNEDLTTLRCYGNQLASLNLTNALDYLRCYNNKLDFAALPVVKGSFKVYEYAPQADVEINETINDGIVDLSSQYSIESNLTTYIWKTESGTVLSEGVDYTIEGGITTFLTTPIEKVYCEMTNATFPDFIGENVLKTTMAIVEGTGEVNPPEDLPTVSLSTVGSVGETISIVLKSEVDNSVIHVDYGDGILVEKTIHTSASDVSGTVNGPLIKIYGDGIVGLNCGGNHHILYALDITNAIELREVDCHYNVFITELDISNNTELITLDCSENRIASLNLANNNRLQHLNCGHNQLTDINVTNNLELTLLDCSSNSLSSLDVSNNTALVELDCSFNHSLLAKLDLGDNVGLRTVDCSYNQLTELDITNQTGLTSLHCSGNSLTNLNIWNNDGLVELNCGWNPLTELDISNNKKLRFLYCYHNNLTSLDLSNAPLLQYLDCSSNQLTVLDVSYNSLLQELWCWNNNLEELDVTNNTLLYTISCYENQISSLDISNNTELDSLVCNNNKITSLDLSNCRDLYILWCSNNQLTSLDVSYQDGIRELFCDHNQLATLKIGTTWQQCQITCEYNQLTFSTLPEELSEVAIKSYAPQADIEISSTVDIATSIDLSDQFEIDGNITNYTWKTESGTILTEGTDYEIDGGITTFLAPLSEKVYCEMTNVTFPDFTGGDALKTTLTEVLESPSDDVVVPANVNVYGGVNSITLQTETEAQVQVYDIYGKPIVSKNVGAGQNTINGISQGMYIVKINGTKAVSTRKVTVRD